MMTGTPIENNVWMAYLLAVFLVVTGFAVYDILWSAVFPSVLSGELPSSMEQSTEGRWI